MLCVDVTIGLSVNLFLNQTGIELGSSVWEPRTLATAPRQSTIFFFIDIVTWFILSVNSFVSIIIVFISALESE